MPLKEMEERKYWRLAVLLVLKTLLDVPHSLTYGPDERGRVKTENKAEDTQRKAGSITEPRSTLTPRPAVRAGPRALEGSSPL